MHDERELLKPGAISITGYPPAVLGWRWRRAPQPGDATVRDARH